MVNKEKQKAKAIEFMKKLGIYKPYIDGFDKQDNIRITRQYKSYSPTFVKGPGGINITDEKISTGVQLGESGDVMTITNESPLGKLLIKASVGSIIKLELNDTKFYVIYVPATKIN